MLNFKSINLDLEKDDKIFSNYESSIYTSVAWLKILKEADKITPIVIEIGYNNKIIGYFIGGLIKKFGIKIIGSPFKGWTTPYMGFIINKDVKDIVVEDIINPLWKFLKKEYNCMYAEICDSKFSAQNLDCNKIKYIISTTYIVNLDKNIEDVFKGFSAHRRQHIKHFEKYGGGIERIKPDKEFLDDFYKMTEDVFAIQGLKPSFSKSKVKLIFDMLPDNMLYCAKAYNKEKKCIGMSVIFGYGDSCQTFMVVTDHKEKYDQNAALFWDAMKYWHSNNIKKCDLLGKRPYKVGFRPEEPTFYRVILTRYKMLFTFRNIAKSLYWKLNHIKYKLRKK